MFPRTGAAELCLSSEALRCSMDSDGLSTSRFEALFSGIFIFYFCRAGQIIANQYLWKTLKNFNFFKEFKCFELLIFGFWIIIKHSNTSEILQIYVFDNRVIIYQLGEKRRNRSRTKRNWSGTQIDRNESSVARKVVKYGLTQPTMMSGLPIPI